MALDGIVLSNIVNELKQVLIGGRIDKIHQTEKDELMLAIRSSRINHKLLLTSNSSYARVHLTERIKVSPPAPPMFCMLLRKHLSGGKILDITMPDFERIVEFHIEAVNELGDKEPKKLIIEIMGRHSNIILTKEDYTILDSIKHIAADKSSVRLVLPGRAYVYPPRQDKANPLQADKLSFTNCIALYEGPVFKSLYASYSGLSPLIAEEICLLANIDALKDVTTLSPEEFTALYTSFESLMNRIKDGQYEPTLFTEEDETPVDFYCFPLKRMEHLVATAYPSPSQLLENFYHDRTVRFVVSQKTSDIKKLVVNFVDRTVRKKALQEKALDDSEKCEKYKVYGELLTAYSYQVPPRSKAFVTTNYYEEPYEEMTIPLDERLTAIENAQKYFKRYSKSKRTIIAAHEQLAIIEDDLNYLNSVLLSLDFLQTPQDIEGLRGELVDMGYLKKRKQKGPKLQKVKIPYMQFTSSVGLDIFVGKNNYQNDELTMKFAKSNDLWLHIKDGPGSHVIVRTNGQEEVDDVSLIEAAMLAGYYSSGKHSSNVAIDYVIKKHVKKVPNAKPGMVIYTNFKTVYVTPDENFIKKLEKTLP